MEQNEEDEKNAEKRQKLHLEKKGLRVLGVSESFYKTGKKSVLAGVVMRADQNIIDGYGIATITVRGMDATEGILKIWDHLKRPDINAIILNGCVIAMFNIIDLERVQEHAQKPVICVTYEESEGIEKYLEEFENAEERLKIYKKNGPRKKQKLYTGHEVYIRTLGLTTKQAKELLDKFTREGSKAEPIRVARLLAHETLKIIQQQNQEE